MTESIRAAKNFLSIQYSVLEKCFSMSMDSHVLSLSIKSLSIMWILVLYGVLTDILQCFKKCYEINECIEIIIK